MELTDKWQKNKWILYAILIAFAISFFLNKCNNSAPKIKYTPEVKGSFVAKEIVNVPIVQKTIGQKMSNLNNRKISNTENKFLQSQIDKLLLENQNQSNEFQKANDSLQQLLYAKAIQLNQFSQSFDDNKVKIDVSGIAQGKVKNLIASYTIKQQPIAPEKQVVFALKTGLEYGNTINFNKGLVKANLEFENKQGNSLSISYDTDKRYWIGYKRTIFKIKR